ncbi:hypothetical protein FACS18945_2380 [Bacteroidia bacterium]|nr:hypothetical protein FACS18945_2380 [Bacteroidia bacterium]
MKKLIALLFVSCLAFVIPCHGKAPEEIDIQFEEPIKWNWDLLKATMIESKLDEECEQDQFYYRIVTAGDEFSLKDAIAHCILAVSEDCETDFKTAKGKCGNFSFTLKIAQGKYLNILRNPKLKKELNAQPTEKRGLFLRLKIFGIGEIAFDNKTAQPAATNAPAAVYNVTNNYYAGGSNPEEQPVPSNNPYMDEIPQPEGNFENNGLSDQPPIEPSMDGLPPQSAPAKKDIVDKATDFLDKTENKTKDLLNKGENAYHRAKDLADKVENIVNTGKDIYDKSKEVGGKAKDCVTNPQSCL